MSRSQSSTLPEDAANIALTMKHGKNVERTACWAVDDEIRESLVEENVSTGEVATPVPAMGNFCKQIEALEELGYDSIGRIETFAVKQEKPDGINVKDGIFGKLKWFQAY